MAAKFRKISISLPIAMVDDLDVISKAFRVTRSALLTQLLTEATEGLKQVCDQHVLPLGAVGGDSAETQRAITETLDRLENELKRARGTYAKSTKH